MNRLVDFDGYAANLAALLAKTPEATRADAYPASVFATFTVALDKVIAGDETTGRPPCPEAETLMGLFAMMAPEPIPLDMFDAETLSPLALGEVVGALAGVSLLTQTELAGGGAAVMLHRLVQEVMRARLRQADAFEKVAAQATTLLATAFEAVDPQDVRDWPRCDALAPHAESVLALEVHAPETGALCNQLGLLYLYRAAYGPAEALLRRALESD